MVVINELLDVNLILRDILIRTDDESLRKGLTKGYYISLVNQSLERLAMQTFYTEEPPMDCPMPDNFRWKLPDNFFNIQELYAFNGDCCNVESSANIEWKRNFNNSPNGDGYTALNKGNEQDSADPYFYSWGGIESNYVGGLNPATGGGGTAFSGRLLYANVQNGFLMFSQSCSGYQNFRVIYNGFGGKIGDKPLVPRPLRRVVTDLCVLEAFKVLMTRNPKSVYGAMVRSAEDTLYNKGYGSFWDADRFTRQSNNWKKNCREQYGSCLLDE